MTPELIELGIIAVCIAGLSGLVVGIVKLTGRLLKVKKAENVADMIRQIHLISNKKCHKGQLESIRVYASRAAKLCK